MQNAIIHISALLNIADFVKCGEILSLGLGNIKDEVSGKCDDICDLIESITEGN
jgi:hypothetical protein